MRSPTSRNPIRTISHPNAQSDHSRRNAGGVTGKHQHVAFLCMWQPYMQKVRGWLCCWLRDSNQHCCCCHYFTNRWITLGKIPNKTESGFPQFPQLYIARKSSIYQQVHKPWDSINNSMGMNLSKLQEIVKDREARHALTMGSQRVRHDLVTERWQNSRSLSVKYDLDFIHRWLLTSFSLKWISFESHEKQGTILCCVELSHLLQNIDIPWFCFSIWPMASFSQSNNKPYASTSEISAEQQSFFLGNHSTRYLRRNKYLRKDKVLAESFNCPFLFILFPPPSSTINCSNFLYVQHLAKCFLESLQIGIIFVHKWLKSMLGHTSNLNVHQQMNK